MTAVGLCFLAASFASQLFAIDPSRVGDSGGVVSLGPAHLACLISTFLSVAYFLRTSRQLQRLIAASLATGFTVGVFALLEAYGFHAPGYAVMPGMQIVSFVGGPIFLAGYLLMLIPPAIWNLHRQTENSRGRLDGAVAIAAAVVLVLVGAFLACDKRGPTVAVLAAICSGMFLLAAACRRRRLLVTAIALAGLAAISLGGLAVLKKAGVPLAKLPYVEKLAAIVPVDDDRNHDYRTMLWAILPDIVAGRDPLTLPSGLEDPNHCLRLLLGYGPDNLQVVLPSRHIFLQAWPSEIMEVSSHSHFWDLAINLGTAGVAAFFALFFAVWYRGLRQIGARPPPLKLAIALATACALASGVVAETLFRPGFFGVGSQIGFLAALLGLALRSPQRVVTKAAPPTSGQLLAVALLASLAGHWIDLAFIFPAEENSVMFWIFAGALCGQIDLASTAPEADDEGRSTAPVWAFAIGTALVIAVIHARVNLGPLLAGHTGLSGIFGPGNAALFAAVLALTAVWAACKLCRPQGECHSGHESPAVHRKICAAGLLYLAAVMWFARWMQSTSPTAENAFLADFWAVHYPLLVILGIFLVAVSTSRLTVRFNLATVATTLLLSTLFAALVWTGPLKDLRSSVSAGFARWLPASAEWLERSISLRPELVRNYYRLANDLIVQAFVTENDAGKKAQALEKAEKILRRGLDVSKFNLLNAKLGKLSLWQAVQEDSPSRKRALADSARQSLREATRFAPQNEPALLDASLVERALFNDEKSADALLQRADDVTLRAAPWQNVVEEEWGYYYWGLACSAEAEQLRRSYAERALLYLQLHLDQTNEALMELPPSTLEDKLRIDTLHARAKTLARAAETLRMLERSGEAAALEADAEALRRQLRDFDHRAPHR